MKHRPGARVGNVFGWKDGWEETRARFDGFWRQQDSVLVTGPVARSESRLPSEAVASEIPVWPRTDPRYYTDTQSRALRNRIQLASLDFPIDTLPIPDSDIGPGSLALLVGSEPGFAEDTVWFEPYHGPETDPSVDATFSFDPDNRWWQVHRDSLTTEAELGEGDYLAACPDLVENIDIIAALRGPEQLLIDMIEEPEWVEAKVAELNTVWFEAYRRIYEIIARDGGACFHAFHLWGTGTTAKIQCDACAMFSPAMFERFVLPGLAEQSRRIDNTLYHLDGHQCLAHLDLLLSIPDLNGIEWTPDPQVPSGGSPEWYDLYRRILDAGKSVQAVGVKPHEVAPLFRACGHRGMFVIAPVASADEARELEAETRELRRG